jgi:hypothetical protein
MMKILASTLLLCASMLSGKSEHDEQGAAPDNPYAAGNVWGQFHRNGYAQAGTPLRGPEAGDRIEVQRIKIPGRGGTPTQMHISERYPDGSYTAWSTNLTHIIKARVKGERFEIADAYEITKRVMDFNVHWNMTLARGNKAFVPSPKTRSILKFGEADPRDPNSKIVLEKTFILPPQIQGQAAVLNLSYDGWLIFVTDKAWIGAVKQDFSEYRAFDLGGATNDVTTHNSFPVDENGNIFIASFYAMTKVKWTGDGFELAWRAPYNFRGTGCPPPSSNPTREVIKAITGKGCTGTGTTPTLVGRQGMDELVVVVDSHLKNNLVAFWRNEMPGDWRGLPGQDKRVAGILSLPYSTWAGDGFSAENSPPAAGYDIAVAQYVGFFKAKCNAPRGVQMARWDPDKRRLGLLWANGAIPFNNVMTISYGSDLLYGSGRDPDCNFVYRALDRQTGTEMLAKTLGTSNDFLDGGNSNAVLPDRSVIYGIGDGMIRIRPTSG